MTVYYFLRHSDNAVKIGFTEQHVETRMRQVAADGRWSLSLLAAEEGTRPREAELHRQFWSAHIGGEWFHRTPELMAHITKLREHTPEGVNGKLHWRRVKAVEEDLRRHIEWRIRNWRAEERMPSEDWLQTVAHLMVTSMELTMEDDL